MTPQKLWLGAVMMLLPVFGAGCPDPEAVEKCRVIGENYCAKQEEYCGPFATPADECEDIYDDTVLCDEALYVEYEYDACLVEIEKIDECVFAMPEDCNGVVVIIPQDDEDEDEDDDDDDKGDAGPASFPDGGFSMGDGGVPF